LISACASALCWRNTGVDIGAPSTAATSQDSPRAASGMVGAAIRMIGAGFGKHP
jgi:hypothetical protein